MTNGKRAAAFITAIGIGVLAVVAVSAGRVSAQLSSTTPQDISNGEPYQSEVNAIFDIGQSSMNVPITDVPAGKRLVVRSINGIIYGPVGEKYKIILLSVVNGGTQQWHPVAVAGESFNDPEAKAHATIFSQTLYVNATVDAQGRILRVSIVRSFNNKDHATFVRLSVSGYLLSDPARASVSTSGQVR